MSVWRNNFPITPLDFFVMKNYCDWKIISLHMTLITLLGFFFFLWLKNVIIPNYNKCSKRVCSEASFYIIEMRKIKYGMQFKIHKKTILKVRLKNRELVPIPILCPFRFLKRAKNCREGKEFLWDLAWGRGFLAGKCRNVCFDYIRGPFYIFFLLLFFFSLFLNKLCENSHITDGTKHMPECSFNVFFFWYIQKKKRWKGRRI